MFGGKGSRSGVAAEKIFPLGPEAEPEVQPTSLPSAHSRSFSRRKENVRGPAGAAPLFGVDVIETETDFLPGSPQQLPVATRRWVQVWPSRRTESIGVSLPSRPPVADKLVSAWTVLSGAAKFRVTVSGCDQSLDQSDRGVDGGGVQTGVEAAGCCCGRQCVEYIAARSR